MTFVPISLKLNVDERAMKSPTLGRSRHILGRDKRLIKKYLDVIQERKLGPQAYRLITDMLRYKLFKLGMQKRFVLPEEPYTFKKCWKCGTNGQRPKQAQFICNNSTCNWQGNADFNGATNIARRAVLHVKLTELVNVILAKEVSGQGAIVPVTNSRTGGNMSIASYFDVSPNENMITHKMRQTVPEDSSSFLDETGQTEARVSRIQSSYLTHYLSNQMMNMGGDARLGVRNA